MLSGRVALIAGAVDEGIARSAALTLALRGARIVWGYPSHGSAADVQASAEQLVGAVRELGGEALARQVDLRQPNDVAKLVGAAVAAFGSVDVLVCRVGSGWDTYAAAQLAAEALDEAVQTEIEGAMLCIQACLPVMRQKNWGRIVAIGPFEPICWTYGGPASSARRFLAQQFERRERPHNVTVNLIHPGWGGLGADSADAALAAARHERTWQLRRQATAQDIADTVLFLCSEPARFITGSQINFALE